MYKVRWEALGLPGFVAIPETAGFSTVEAANKFAQRCIDGGKTEVCIEPPTPADEERLARSIDREEAANRRREMRQEMRDSYARW